MAASIFSLRYLIRDTQEPYTFPDEILQEALDAAADFINRKYNSATGGNNYALMNDRAILRVQNGTYGWGTSWIDIWNDAQYHVDIDTPTGAKLQKLMAGVDLLSTLLIPTPDRSPMGVSEGGLSIQWGGDYNSAIDKWNAEIEKIMFALSPPFVCVYNNY